MAQEGRVYLSIKVSRGGSAPDWLPSFLERRIAPGHCVFYCTFAGGAFNLEARRVVSADGAMKEFLTKNALFRDLKKFYSWDSLKPRYEIHAVKRLTREQYLHRLHRICPPKG